MFDRLLFNLAKRRFVTEGWNFRTRSSAPAYQYRRATVDDYSREGHVTWPPWRC